MVMVWSAFNVEIIELFGDGDTGVLPYVQSGWVSFEVQ